MTGKVKAFLLFSFAVLLALVFAGHDATAPAGPHPRPIQAEATVKAKVQKIMAFVSDANEKSAYEAKLETVLERMPTLSQQSFQRPGESNEIHGFLPEEFAEGHKLAQLRKLSLENENYLPSTQTTYAACAERSDLAEAVRAICFMRAMEISIKLKNPEHVVGLNVPVNVRELALKLVN